MSAELATSSTDSNTRSEHLAGPEASVRLVTVMVGIVVGLTFLFGFGNVATLGIRLGIPTGEDSHVRLSGGQDASSIDRNVSRSGQRGCAGARPAPPVPRRGRPALAEIPGVEVADRIRQIRPGIKVLHLTGYDQRTPARNGIPKQAVNLLVKPLRGRSDPAQRRSGPGRRAPVDHSFDHRRRRPARLRVRTELGGAAGEVALFGQTGGHLCGS